jgi:hypothetical protein
MNKLSNPNKILLYDYLCHLEKELKSSFGEFDMDNNNLCAYLEKNSILLGSYTATNEKNKGGYKYFLLSNLRKPEKYKEIPGNDYAYLHLKHIRNAIAHGNIVKKKGCFWLNDYNQNGTQTLEAKIPADIFWDFLTELENTYH